MPSRTMPLGQNVGDEASVTKFTIGNEFELFV